MDAQPSTLSRALQCLVGRMLVQCLPYQDVHFIMSSSVPKLGCIFLGVYVCLGLVDPHTQKKAVLHRINPHDEHVEHRIRIEQRFRTVWYMGRQRLNDLPSMNQLIPLMNWTVVPRSAGRAVAPAGGRGTLANIVGGFGVERVWNQQNEKGIGLAASIPATLQYKVSLQLKWHQKYASRLCPRCVCEHLQPEFHQLHRDDRHYWWMRLDQRPQRSRWSRQTCQLKVTWVEVFESGLLVAFIPFMTPLVYGANSCQPELEFGCTHFWRGLKGLVMVHVGRTWVKSEGTTIPNHRF